MMEAFNRPLASSARRPNVDPKPLVSAIEACMECELACTACADALLSEPHLEGLRYCIRINLDCADVCATTGRILARALEPDWTSLQVQLDACALFCATCEAECRRHLPQEHCRRCAEECRRCAAQCRELARAMPAAA